ncbi:MAG TPA: sialate O-acetylesterase [Opitutaceae bacterium]|nr:sialate O-acetylesterase [Opitutaceae bacterium]
MIRRSLALALTGLFCARAFALDLGSPFTSHMVLQCDQPVPVWGTADAGEQVTVAFAGQKRTATADDQGNWRVELQPLKVSVDAQPLTVSGSENEDPLELTDVLVGEVWLCSGQSNMDFTVAKTDKYYFAGVNNEAAEVAAADYPDIRMFTGEWTRSYTPQARVAGQWKVCTPENVREFSAIGYFFARDLQRALHVPVGIVTLTYGASTAQAWIRREAIAADPRLKPVLDEFDAKVKAYVPPTEDDFKRWMTAAEKAKTAKRRPPRRPHPDPTQDQHNPTVLYNGMIAPVVPFAIRGVLWYQGESITAPRELFPVWNETLINDWRKLWGRRLPFYFCQLASQRAASNGPDVREWQTEALKLPGTAMAVTVDIGDEHSVHPKDKQDVGDRLCRIALAKTYGRPVEYSGPQLVGVKSFGGALELTFSHTTGGLSDHGQPLHAFEVAGADGHFFPARANLDGNSVFVSSPDVAVPVTARYAWSAYPGLCNFYNGDGLPAAPFRTDAPMPRY